MLRFFTRTTVFLILSVLLGGCFQYTKSTTLERVAGKANVNLMNALTLAEDFSYFQNEIPGFFFFLGGTPLDMKESDAPSHHTPSFIIDDSSMKLGVKTLSNLALDYLKN